MSDRNIWKKYPSLGLICFVDQLLLGWMGKTSFKFQYIKFLVPSVIVGGHQGHYLHLSAVIIFIWKFADPFSFNITSGVIMKSSPMSFWGQCISYRWPRRSTSPTKNPSNSFSKLSDIFMSQNVTDTIQTMKRHFTNIYYNFASLTSASERGMWLDCFI